MRGVSQCAAVLHGTGSTAEFLTRAFGPAVTDRDWALIAHDDRTGQMDAMVAALAECTVDPAVAVIGGVSLGAHAAAAFAARTGWRGGLLLVMPAWSGQAGDVARLTSQTADRIAARGVEPVLADIEAHAAPGDWVVAELIRAWRSYPPHTLIDCMRAAGSQSAPTPEELASIRARTVVVGLRDDPTHPVSVAGQWADSIPGARLALLDRDLAGRDVDVLGRTALAALG